MVKLPDCSADCKDSKYIVYIENIKEIICLVDELSLILYSIKELGYTELQSKIVSEQLFKTTNSKFKLFTGDKDTSFKILDELLINKLSAGIYKKTEDIFK